ncbi:hypothetical protein B277_00510 [Janibacter hoylei PVAS-1]|uniref:YjeF N-terminal domain-containing protein n=1 Tax=Janibacter hoylei PVAS-1 TaxID=1210046 RepID=K1E6F5_9MICO|nr:NAD(P)H-hydrate epimerase [Janibacter hoylei]EKA62656.1 hypothetical protein B277_00510 [Janibacter hoylei PVAS-1]
MITGYSVETVRAAEAALPELLESGELMQRAARGVARIAAGRMRERGARRVCALVGPGNNGADTLFAIARLAKRGFETAAVCVDTSASQVQTEAADLARARPGSDCSTTDPRRSPRSPGPRSSSTASPASADGRGCRPSPARGLTRSATGPG